MADSSDNFRDNYQLRIQESDRPKIKDLYRIGVIKNVSSACATRTTLWVQLGYELLLDQSDLNIIAANNSHDVERCCLDTFSLWLEKQPKASWEKLKRALIAIELKQLASIISEELSPVQASNETSIDSDDPTAKAPVIIDDPEDKEILKGDTKILEVTTKTDIKTYYYNYVEKLVKCLPMNDASFITKLSQQRLLPGNTQNEISTLPTPVKKAIYFLDSVIKPALEIGDSSNFEKLLSVMENCDYDHVEKLSGEIKSEINQQIGHKSDDQMKSLRIYRERFSEDDVEDAFMYLINKLEALWSESDFSQLRKIWKRDVRLPNELKGSLKNSFDLEEAFDLLTNSPFCTWLELQILKRMARAADIPQATDIINVFEECVHKRKCAEVKKKYFKKKYINPDYFIKVKAKLNKNAEHLVVADLIKYCQELESVLEIPAVPGNIHDGCLEINLYIPTYSYLHAYMIAKNNFLKLRPMCIQYLQIGTRPKIYATNLHETSKAQSVLSKLKSVDNWSSPSQVIDHYYTYLESYMDADSVSHMMHYNHLITDDDYKAITTAPNDSKMNFLLLQYVRAMDLSSLLKFAEILQSIETQKSIGNHLELSLKSTLNVDSLNQNTAPGISLDISVKFLNLVDKLVMEMSTADVAGLVKACGTLMASDVHKIPLFSPDFINKLNTCVYPFIFKIYLLAYTSWFDNSILIELIKNSDYNEAVSLVDQFFSGLDYDRPVATYCIPEFSQLLIPLDNSGYTLLATKPIRNFNKLTLKDLMNIKKMLVQKLEVTDHAVFLVALHHNSCCLYWLIPNKIRKLVEDKLNNKQLELWNEGILLTMLLPINFFSHNLHVQQNIADIFNVRFKDPSEMRLMKHQVTVGHQEFQEVIRQKQVLQDKNLQLSEEISSKEKQLSLKENDFKKVTEGFQKLKITSVKQAKEKDEIIQSLTSQLEALEVQSTPENDQEYNIPKLKHQNEAAAPSADNIDVLVPKVTITAPTTQVVGHSLTLICLVIAVRGITSKMDIVWSSGGIELERMDGVLSTTMGNLLVFSNSYSISQLSTTDDGRVIQCEAVINTNPLVTAKNSITLDITVPTPTITISPSDSTQVSMVGNPQKINCTVNTVSGVESSSIMINWLGPKGISVISDSRVIITPTVSTGSTYFSSLQFTYLKEEDKGMYTCNVTMLKTSVSKSYEIKFLANDDIAAITDVDDIAAITDVDDIAAITDVITLNHFRSEKEKFKKPQLRHVYKYVVPEYAHRWRYLGALLDFKQTELDIIFSNFQNDTEECCRSLLSRWLKKSEIVTWDHLFRAIDDLPPSFHSDTTYEATFTMARTAREVFKYYNQGLLACLPMKDSTFLEILKSKSLLPDEVKNSLEQMNRTTERSSYFLEKIIKAGFEKGHDSYFINLLAAMIESSYDNVKDLGMEIQNKLSIVDVVQDHDSTVTSNVVALNYFRAENKKFERPELRDVYKCMVPEYAHRWEELGMLLHFKQSELAIILSDFHDDAKRCRNLLSTWLEKNSNASWDQLIRAIDDLPPSRSETAYQGTPAGVMNTVNNATQQLQQRYIKSKFSLSVEEWPPYQPKHYTKLAFIHNKGKHTDAVRLSITQELAVAGKINPPKFPKHSDLNVSMTKNISDIFLPIVLSDGSSVDLYVLIEGAPGIGKTVLAKEIAYQWANNELLRSNKLLLLVFLRECHQTQLKSVENLLQFVFKNDIMIPCLTNHILQTEGSDTVVVFDGYDELPEEIKKNSIIADIINRRILTKCCLVVTSRPTASACLHGNVDRRVEVVGFTEEDRLDYIQSVFKNCNKKVKALQHYLQSNPTINALCYIPLNMTILLCLAEDGIDTLPKTQTELYKNFTQMTIVRFIKKYENLDTIISIANLPNPYSKVFTELTKLAFQALKTDKIVFTLFEIEQGCPNLTMNPSNWNGLGLLKAVQHFSLRMRNDQVTFHFLHFSVQEYLAAWYISTLSDNKQIKLLKETFWEHRYYNTWIMYVGITGGSSFALKHFLSANRFQFYSKLFKPSVIFNKYLKHKMKCLHIFQCLVEADKENYVESMKQLFQNNQINLSNQTLLPSDLNTLGFFLIRSINKEWDELDLSYCNIESNGSNILCDRLSDKDVRGIFTVKRVDFSHNQLSCSSVIRLLGLFKCWHTSEIIITDDAILDNTTDTKAIEDIVLQSSTLTLVLIGCYLFSKNLLPSKVLDVLLNKSFITSIYLLNCSWTLPDPAALKVLSLLEKQELDKIRIISSSLNKTSIKKMALILLNKSIPVNMLIYDPTMSDEIADEISSLIASSYIDISGVMLIVSANKVQGIVNTSTLSSKLSALELFNLNTYVKHSDIKMCQWIENIDYCDQNIVIDTFTKMLYKIDMKCQLSIALLEKDILILHKVKFSKLAHPTNSVSVIYLSDCDVTEYDSIIKQCSTVYVFENSRLKLVYLHSDTKKHEVARATYFINTLNNITTLNTIKIINFGIREETAGDLADVLYLNTQLQEIYLNGNNLQTVSVIKIFKGLQAVSTLQVISISNNNIINEAANDIAAVITCNTDLQELNLGGNDLRTLGTIKIAKGLQKISSLKKLFIDHNNITDEAADDIAAVISCNMDLQQLNLGNNDLQTSGIVTIAKNLQKISSLTYLCITHNNITDEAADDIALAIICNTHLQELKIGYNKFHGLGAMKIMKGLQKISKLTKLHVEHNNITDEAADDIASAIISNTHLQELKIGYNKFHDLGAVKIAKGLQKISKLTKLHINDNYITDEAADDIGLAIHSNVNLQEVDISRNNFHEETALKIASFAKSSYHWN